MKKEIKNILLGVLIAIGTWAPTAAQQAVGTWYKYPLYALQASKVIVTPDKTYSLVSGRLYSNSVDGEELTDYTGVLNGNNIVVAEYNPEGGYLALAYDDGLIDLLKDNGDVVCLADIRDAVLDYSKTVNAIDFAGSDTMYVATAFGLVEYNTKSGVVKQSGIYGVPVKAVGVLGNRVVLGFDNNEIKFAERDKRFNRLENLQPTTLYYYTYFRHLGPDKMLLKYNNGMKVVEWNGTELKEVNSTGMADNQFVNPAEDGGVYAVGAKKLWHYGQDGTVTQVGNIPADLTSRTGATRRGMNDFWSAGIDGVARYNLSTTPATVLAQPSKPDNATTVGNVYFFELSNDQERLYVGNLGPMRYNSAGSGEGFGIKMALDCHYSDGRIEDAKITTNAAGKPTEVTTFSGIVEDPDKPGRLYISLRSGSIQVVENNKIVGTYNTGQRMFTSEIDPEGNLWCMVFSLDYKNSVWMLPKAKRLQDPSTVKNEDWLKPATVTGILANRETSLLICKKSQMIFATSASPGDRVWACDTKGTYGNFADDNAQSINDTFTTTDGESLGLSFKTCLLEDLNGKIWITGAGGILVLDNPMDGVDPNVRWRRPKVPRNDGTNYADYLLDGIGITGMTVDNSNRKWFATKSSGLYLVSAEGDEILGHYTTSNSPLPTDNINSVWADPRSNLLYIGTNYGLMTFSMDSAPSQDDFSAVYAYPNPVKPNFSGWITVAGLMNNSLVKIADASGNVVYQGRSEGGMMTWDGCNMSGSRVKSGVYYVFASSGGGDTGSSKGAVAKILIMN